MIRKTAWCAVVACAALSASASCLRTKHDPVSVGDFAGSDLNRHYAVTRACRELGKALKALRVRDDKGVEKFIHYGRLKRAGGHLSEASQWADVASGDDPQNAKPVECVAKKMGSKKSEVTYRFGYVDGDWIVVESSTSSGGTGTGGTGTGGTGTGGTGTEWR